jgi:hypothetical protein
MRLIAPEGAPTGVVGCAAEEISANRIKTFEISGIM